MTETAPVVRAIVLAPLQLGFVPPRGVPRTSAGSWVKSRPAMVPGQNAIGNSALTFPLAAVITAANVFIGR